MDPALRMFLWGCIGSAAIELLTIYRLYVTGRRFPKRYHLKGFWLVRALLVLLAGLVAMGYSNQGVQSDILGLHLGAATPTILGSFFRKDPETQKPHAT